MIFREWFDGNGPEYRVETDEGLETLAAPLLDTKTEGKESAAHYLRVAEVSFITQGHPL